MWQWCKKLECGLTVSRETITCHVLLEGPIKNRPTHGASLFKKKLFVDGSGPWHFNAPLAQKLRKLVSIGVGKGNAPTLFATVNGNFEF